MAGEIRGVGGGSSIPKPIRKVRKLWSLQDRSVVSVHLLKANLAEDGCEEAQLDVAKRLLNDSNIDANDATAQCENARLAVYWFIKASEQGSEEATRHLQECFDSGRGITCQNILDVKACLNTPKNEKLTFKAARQLYTKLCNGEDFITTTQLHARLESKKYKPKVTFGVNGQGPSPTFSGAGDAPFQNLNDTFLLASDEDENEPSSCFNSAESEYLAGIRNKRGEGERSSDVKLTLDSLLTAASKFNEGELPPTPIRRSSTVLASQEWNLWTPSTACAIQLIFIAVGCNLITTSTAVYSTLAYLSSWSSYNFILHRKRCENFQDWSEVFRSSLKEEVPWTGAKARSKFHRNYFRPYGLTSLLCGSLFLLIFDDHILTNILIGSLTVFTLGHSRGGLKRSTVFKDLAFHILLISLKFFSPHCQQTLTSYKMPAIIKNYVSRLISRIPQTLVCLSVGLIFVAAIFTITLLINKISSRRRQESSSPSCPRRRPGQPKESLEHFWTVCLVAWYVKCPQEVANGQLVVAVTLLLLTLHFLFESNLKSSRVLGSIAAAILIFGLFIPQSQFLLENKTVQPEVGWAEYEATCHRPAWRFRSVAEVQMKCLETYKNHRVNWTGKLSYVKLREEDGVKKAKEQDLVFEMLININAGEIKKGQDGIGEPVNWNWVDLLPAIFQKHSDGLAIAPVMLVISSEDFGGSDSSTALISYIHSFRSGDMVQFVGILTRNLGGFKPEIGKVEQLTCISCADAKNNGITFQLGTNGNFSGILDQLTASAAVPFKQLNVYIPILW